MRPLCPPFQIRKYNCSVMWTGRVEARFVDALSYCEDWALVLPHASAALMSMHLKGVCISPKKKKVEVKLSL
jgi:hypothetical protein